MTTTLPEIEVQKDFDGYFENLVRGWVARKKTPFNHTKIVVTSGVYRPDAMTYKSKDGVIYLDFYSAIRNGFGGLTKDEIEQIVELL